MPIEFRDADGTPRKGGTVHVWGGTAVGCVLFLVCALVGIVYIVSGIVSLVL